MPTFKKLNPKIFQKSGPNITPDYIYWKKQGVRVRVLVIHLLIVIYFRYQY